MHGHGLRLKVKYFISNNICILKKNESKICNKCEKISPKTDFYKNENNKDGHLNACKNCSKCYNEKELSVFNFRKDIQKYINQCRVCIKLINKENRTINEGQIKIQRKEY